MTVSMETLIDRSLSNIGKVESFVKDKAIEIIKEAYQERILVQFSSGLRTFKEQDALYAKGRTAPGSIVTNAKAGQSVHNYGLALDFFLVSEDGQKALWTVNDKWKRVVVIGKSLGFDWGGEWTNFKDYAHLEFTQGLTWQDLKAGKRPVLSEEPKVEEKKDEVSSWAKAAHAWIIENNISDGKRPKDPVTREEVWTIAFRLFNLIIMTVKKLIYSHTK